MHLMREMAAIAAALALGACSVDWDTFKAPDSSIFAPRSVAALRDSKTRAITPEDLVDAEGRCGGALASAAPDASTGSPAAAADAPQVPGGIAPEMSECEVVKRIGPPERVTLGTNERSERTATLTYLQGMRPGIYHFTSGRLTLMERAPEPPPRPARPAPKKKRANT